MSIIVSEGEGKKFTPAPSGTHQAVCFGLWDIGYHDSTFNGKEVTLRKLIVGWEIDELMEEGEFKGKRFTIYKTYTASLSEKANLRRDLESWRDKVFTDEERKRFDVEKLYGVNCMLSILHKEGKGGKTYANIVSVSKLAKGMKPMLPENPREMPKWIERLKEKSVMDSKLSNTTEVVEPKEDEIPF